MRTLLRILALVPLVLPLVGPATSGAATISPSSDAVSALAGHWRCTSSDGATSRRSYVVLGGTSAAVGSSSTRAAGGARAGGATPFSSASVARTVYARQDSAGDAAPSFERLTMRPDGNLALDAPEGAGVTSAIGGSTLRFGGLTAVPARAVPTSEEAVGAASAHRATATGRYVQPILEAPVSGRAPLAGTVPRYEESASTVKTLTVTYSVENNGMRRIASSGNRTLSDEHCLRDASSVASASCARTTASAAMLHAVMPSAPATAQGVQAVQLHLVLDDRAQVVGEDVVASPSAALNASALAAARDSRFSAEVRGCRAVATELAFTVRFSDATLRNASNNGRETNL